MSEWIDGMRVREDQMDRDAKKDRKWLDRIRTYSNSDLAQVAVHWLERFEAKINELAEAQNTINSLKEKIARDEQDAIDHNIEMDLNEP